MLFKSISIFLQTVNQLATTTLTTTFVRYATVLSKLIHLSSYYHYTTVKINTQMWYWVWAESSIYDFFVSSLLNRMYILTLTVLTFNTISSFLEFVFFFKITSLYTKYTYLTNVFGTKVILITFVLLVATGVVILLII